MSALYYSFFSFLKDVTNVIQNLRRISVININISQATSYILIIAKNVNSAGMICLLAYEKYQFSPGNIFLQNNQLMD